MNNVLKKKGANKSSLPFFLKSSFKVSFIIILISLILLITTFTFEEPVYITGNTDFSIVLLSDSNEYNVFVAEAGEFLLGSTERRLVKQATLGSLFKSQNGSTWEPDQTKDLMFTVG